MARAHVEQEIGRLDALSRTRALTERESARLARLITADKRYHYSRSANRSRPKPKPCAPRTIAERIDATIEAMAREKMSVRAIYLRAEDAVALKAAGLPTDTYRGHPIRPAKPAAPSRIYSTFGVARSVRTK